MADIKIAHEDQRAVLIAQRNEAWDAAAMNGAAVRTLLRANDELQARVKELEDQINAAAQSDKVSSAT